MYATLTEYNILTGATDDDRSSAGLTMAQGILDSILTNQEKRQLTKTVAICDIKVGQFRSDVLNIASIDKINGKTYTGSVNKNYKINGWKNCACFINDWINYTAYDVPFVDVTYTAGYDPVPGDLKQAHIQLTQLLLTKQSGGQVKSYKMGPVSYTFDDSQMAAETIGSVTSILSAYQL